MPDIQPLTTAEIATWREDRNATVFEQRMWATIDGLQAQLREVSEGLGFAKATMGSDAHHNLGGAIIDIERGPITDVPNGGYICDAVCLRTLKRVEEQLGRAAALVGDGK